jgi:ppGpp synthetase/RelA/SpoT-type nucleotidyltranferase
MNRKNDDSTVLYTFLDEYERYVKEVLQPTHLEIQKVLEIWQQPGHWGKYSDSREMFIPTPIRTALSRIKRPEQVVDKILRKKHRFPEGLKPISFQTMYDTIGVRIVVYFLSHLPLIDRELRNAELMEISSEEPPVAYMSTDQARILGLSHLEQVDKPSGYRSVHYKVRLRKSSLPNGMRPTFELQVRTVAQDLWSALEHHLGYKPAKRTHSTARTQLRILSGMLSAIDENFDLLYGELSRFQKEREYDPEETLTVETLPSVLSEVGIICAQRDINNVLKLLDSRGVQTVRDMLELATPRRLDIIRNTYHSTLGRHPADLELVANLAAMRGSGSESEEIQRIKMQIAYRGAWESIRRDTQTASSD